MLDCPFYQSMPAKNFDTLDTKLVPYRFLGCQALLRGELLDLTACANSLYLKHGRPILVGLAIDIFEQIGSHQELLES